MEKLLKNASTEDNWRQLTVARAKLNLNISDQIIQKINYIRQKDYEFRNKPGELLAQQKRSLKLCKLYPYDLILLWLLPNRPLCGNDLFLFIFSISFQEMSRLCQVVIRDFCKNYHRIQKIKHLLVESL